MADARSALYDEIKQDGRLLTDEWKLFDGTRCHHHLEACFAPRVKLASLRGETSDFVRFNHAAVRQAGSVQQQSLSIDLISGRNHAEGSVTLTDLAPGMLAVAARNAEARGLANVEIDECSADDKCKQDHLQHLSFDHCVQRIAR